MDLAQELTKEAGFIGNAWNAVKAFGKSRAGVGTMAGLAGIGAGIGGALITRRMFTNMNDVARVLVNLVTQKNPAKYSKLTPAQREAAIGALAREFQMDATLGDKARRAAGTLSNAGIV